jgi:pyruvate,water dikinase
VVSGIAASAGVVTGRARVVGGLAEADDLQDGDILVCPSTSPPWTPYFRHRGRRRHRCGRGDQPRGIEAREYGIPAVVGTREATRRIPDGARVTVDGAAGTITILG